MAQIHQTLATLLAGNTLAEDEAEALFEDLLTGELDDPQIASLLSLIQARGATVDEIVGAARVMRRHVTPVSTPADATVIDTCGTGGAPKTFNVSTAAAIVAAAASPHHTGTGPRIVVAKHGNRSRTGRGSAEILSALGVNVDASTEVQGRCLAEAGVCFCFAIHHHPAMKHAIGPRRSLAFPTIFNLLGPLTNPAGAKRQLIGVYAPEFVEKIAQALSRLGATQAIVAHGADGLDELSTTGPSTIAHVQSGTVSMKQVELASVGLEQSSLDQLQARDIDHAVQIIRDVFAGEPGPCRDIVALNAAAAIFIAQAAVDLKEGVQRALEAIDSGRAEQTLTQLAAVSNP